MTTLSLTTTQTCVDFFQQRVLRAVEYWLNHDAVQQLKIAYLDKEREAILKAISVGLQFEPAWPVVRALIKALTPYMERRGHWDAWRLVLERAITVAQRLGDDENAITLTALLARLSQRQSRPADVVRYYRHVIRLARRSGNEYELARACSNLGYFYVEIGRWWRSEVFSRYALSVFEELSNDHGMAHTHNHLGILFIRQRKWLDAESHLTTACQIWQEMQDKHSLIYGFENLALLYNETQNPQKSLNYLAKAEDLIRDTGEESGKATVWSNMALAHRLIGNVDEAIVYAKKAEEIYRRDGNTLALARVWHSLGLVYLQNMQTSQAEYYRDETLKIYRQLNYQVGEKQLMKDYGL